MSTRTAILNVQTDLWRAGAPNEATNPDRKRSPVCPRVVALLPLSRDVPARQITSQLARAVRRETGQSVLLVELDSLGGSVSFEHWKRIQPGLNGEFCFADDLRHCDGYELLQLKIDSASAANTFPKPFLAHLGDHFRHVLLSVGAETPASALVELLASSDVVYLLLSRTVDSLYDLDLLMRQVSADARVDVSRFRPILCLANGEQAVGLRDSIRKIAGPLHAFLHGCPIAAGTNSHADGDKVFEADLRRWAREITRRRLGLALSSGGAKGLAHIGVIQILEENGIDVDVVAGCSMGAYVAAVWGYGCDGALMEKLSREVEGRWGLWKLIDPVIPPRHGFMRGEAVKRRLQKTVGDAHFSDLPRPVHVVATNLYTLERTVFSGGEVAGAVHASIAIPGVCTPVLLGDEWYVDGGISDPLPVDVLEEHGVERIIAVNTIPTPAYMRCCLEMEREQAELRGRRFNLLKALNRRINYFAPGNVLDIMMRAVHGAQIRVAEEACRRADVVLRPLSVDAHWYEFDKPGKYITLGRRAAEERLEEILALVKGEGPSHDPDVAENQMATTA